LLFTVLRGGWLALEELLGLFVTSPQCLSVGKVPFNLLSAYAPRFLCPNGIALLWHPIPVFVDPPRIRFRE
jgi:hypothetical protein